MKDGVCGTVGCSSWVLILHPVFFLHESRKTFKILKKLIIQNVRKTKTFPKKLGIPAL